MSRRWTFFVAVAVAFCLAASPLRAQELRKLAKGLRLLGRAAFAKEAPRVPGQPDLEELAKEIDWLEHLIESNGSVVAKHPDIWGEERLTKHRHEYEKEIAKRFDSASFDAGLQAAVRRSDQSMLALAFSLNAASSGGTVPTTNNAVTLLGQPGFSSIPQSPPIGLDLKQFATKELSLEPTLVSDQLSRYLNHLNQLRRINEGGDTADSPGYALNLMRIPISVLPGHRTRKGYAAEVTFTLEPYLSNDLLPTTTRSLVINDVADLWVVPLAQFFNNDPEEAKSFIDTHWKFRASVNKWMQTFDRILMAVADPLMRQPGFAAEDVQYLFLQRSYFQFRLTQLAGLAASERHYWLRQGIECAPEQSVAKESISNVYPNCRAPDKCVAEVAQPCPLYIGAIPKCCTGKCKDTHIVTVWACQLADFLDTLDISSTPPNGTLRFFVDGEPYDVSLEIDTSRITRQGDISNRHQLPLKVLSVRPADEVAAPSVGARANRKTSSDQEASLDARLTRQLLDSLDPNAALQLLNAVDEEPLIAVIRDFDPELLQRILIKIDPRLVREVLEFFDPHYGRLTDTQVRALLNGDPKSLKAALAAQLESVLRDQRGKAPGMPHESRTAVRLTAQDTRREREARRESAPRRTAAEVFRDVLRSVDAEMAAELLRRLDPGLLADLVFALSEKPEVELFIGQRLRDLVDSLPGWTRQVRAAVRGRAATVAANAIVDQPYDNVFSGNLDQYARGPMIDLFSYGAQPFTAPTNNGPAEPALTAAQFWVAYDFQDFMNLAMHAHASVRTTPANHKIVHVMDIYDYLVHEATAAYKLLERKDNMALWSFCNYGLAQAIVERDLHTVIRTRAQFMDAIGGATRNTVTAALAWAIIVDAARLNDRLIEDMRSVSMAKDCRCVDGNGHQFVGPLELITPEAHEAFCQYVRCRWPVIVFSLDPLTDDQNVADVFSRRRELQLAMSVAVSKGEVSPSAALNFVRNLETDIETIALNRTAVAFSHSNDTFGWRFYPRVQSPDTPGNLVAFGQTLFGGPTRDQDLRDRQLEPAIRDCAAVVIMPSFVPYVTLKSRSNWFCLTNPRSKELTLHDDMRISRTYQALAIAARQAPNTPVYRPEDVSALRDTLKQLEQRLPLQQTKVEVPFHNNLGGFELFETGINGLGPVLTGWYGAPGIDPDAVTTLYLVGKRFNVHETRIIAGGRYVPFRMLSRRVLEVTVPPGAQRLDAPVYDNFIDVQAAAPYGVSSHLLIPRVSNAVVQARFTWSTTASTIDVLYKDANNPTPQAVVATVPPEIRFFSPTPSAPISLPLNITINEARRGGGELVLYKGSLNARLDIARARYVIDGDQFAALSDALKATATTRFATEKPNPNQTARWLVRGSVTIPGGVPEPIASSMVLDVTFKLQP